MNKKDLIRSLKTRRIPRKVLKAFEKVDREKFIFKNHKEYVYEDRPLPIGFGQTISQPYTIALMLSFLDLKKGQNVLEIGSGCGYVLALISEITETRVFGIERIKQLATKSRKNLKNYDVKIYNKNGEKGLEKNAPFDRILISAGCEQEVPKKIFSQLKNKGILVAPVGPRQNQAIIVYKKIKGKIVIIKKSPGFIFVPFVRD